MQQQHQVEDWLLRQQGCLSSTSLSLRLQCAALWECLDEDPNTPTLRLDTHPNTLNTLAIQHLALTNTLLDKPNILQRVAAAQTAAAIAEEQPCAICGLSASQLFDAINTHNEAGNSPFTYSMEDLELAAHMQGEEAHGLCVVWCPRVYEKDSDGELMFVNEEIRRGKRTVRNYLFIALETNARNVEVLAL
jgi:hypothetical protein